MTRAEGRPGERQEFVEFAVNTAKGEVRTVAQRAGEHWNVIVCPQFSEGIRCYGAPDRESAERMAEVLAAALEFYDPAPAGVEAEIAAMVEPDFAPHPDIAPFLARSRNMTGPLDSEVKARIDRLYRHPSEETWEAAFSAIIGANGWTTLWQVILKVDPSFPRTGPSTSDTGRRLKGWSRIPDAALVLAALQHATEGPR